MEIWRIIISKITSKFKEKLKSPFFFLLSCDW